MCLIHIHNAASFGIGVELPHYQSVKSLRGATWRIVTFESLIPKFWEEEPFCRIQNKFVPCKVNSCVNAKI